MPSPTSILGYRSKVEAIMALHADGKTPAEISAMVGQSERSVAGTIRSKTIERRKRELLPWQYEKAVRIMPQVYEVVAEAIGCTPRALVEAMKSATMIFPSAPVRPTGEADVSDDPPEVADEPALVDGTASTDPTEAGQFQSDASHPDASAVGGGEEPEPEPADHSLSAPPNPLPDQQVAKLRNLEKQDFPKAETDVLQMKPKTQTAWDERVSSGLVTLRDPLSGRYLNLDGSALTDDRRYIYRGTIVQARAMRNKNPLAKGLSFRTFNTRTT